MRESERREFQRRAADLIETPVWAAADLRAEGMSRRRIAAAVCDGELVRARRDSYLAAGTRPELIAAVVAGGVLTCVSALRLLGVFVLERSRLHVLVPPHASRLPAVSRHVVRHWREPLETPTTRRACALPTDMLIHAVRCQPPRPAIATLDSAIHTGLIRPSDIPDVFAALPKRYARLERLIDGRAESGPESLVRLLLRGLCSEVQVQVRIAGVGRVDLLVDGWLVIECDSEAHHLGPEAYRVDRARDLALAELGLTTLRVSAVDIMWHPGRVAAALRGLLGARRRRLVVPFSG
ncbi:hypothetical protein ACIQLK_12150 [Microbacterium sp. NPDC091382]|uniref:endonuclease domain-containing protein n=1 Tax=Microbacterium sp. NPDC091382 TaxID=3364210 RepID=UPI0038218DDD